MTRMNPTLEQVALLSSLELVFVLSFFIFSCGQLQHLLPQSIVGKLETLIGSQITVCPSEQNLIRKKRREQKNNQKVLNFKKIYSNIYWHRSSSSVLNNIGRRNAPY